MTGPSGPSESSPSGTLGPSGPRGEGGFRPPATISSEVLLEGGGDRRFRRMVYDMLSLEMQMRAMRDHLGAEIGVGGPGYAILMAIAQHQGENVVAPGVGVGALARYLHVSGPFITAEVGKLAAAKLVEKRPNLDDRRGVLLSLSSEGERRVAGIAPKVRAANDYFFGSLSAAEFATLSTVAARLGGKSTAEFLSATSIAAD